MNGTNLVIIIGTVGKDPEVKSIKTANGDRKVASFSLATNEKFKDKQETSWHNVEVWGPLAEVVENYVTKGKALYVRGKIKYDQYEKDGVKKTFTKIVAEEISFVGAKDSGSSESSEPSVSATASATKNAEKNVAAYTNSPADSTPYDDGDLPF